MKKEKKSKRINCTLFGTVFEEENCNVCDKHVCDKNGKLICKHMGVATCLIKNKK